MVFWELDFDYSWFKLTRFSRNLTPVNGEVLLHIYRVFKKKKISTYYMELKGFVNKRRSKNSKCNRFFLFISVSWSIHYWLPSVYDDFLVQFLCITKIIQFFVNDLMKNSMERISRIFKKKDIKCENENVVKMKENSKWQKMIISWKWLIFNLYLIRYVWYEFWTFFFEHPL